MIELIKVEEQNNKDYLEKKKLEVEILSLKRKLIVLQDRLSDAQHTIYKFREWGSEY
jgi:hypothetical protein